MVMSCRQWSVICMGGEQGDDCALVQNIQRNCQSCRTDIFSETTILVHKSVFSIFSLFKPNGMNLDSMDNFQELSIQPRFIFDA